MTELNYRYRTNPLFLRNQFKHTGKYGIPIIPKPCLSYNELEGIRFIGYDKIKADQKKHQNRIVHFFLYDYKFEQIWNQSEKLINNLQQYKAILTPDFSMYTEMPEALQLYNTFRNRWCGAYFAGQGLQVIPTLNFGLESSFDFAFEGVEKGSVVAVSTYMVQSKAGREAQKEFFLAGYNEMLCRIKPEVILCYHKPFPEMQLGEPYEVVKYGGYVVQLGSGSAYGGKWKPSKPDDERLLGQPGEIKRYGEKETHIGSDGRADRERYHNDAPNPKYHTNPHDHDIDWSTGRPSFGPPQNYPTDLYPDGPPAFKARGVNMNMETNIEKIYRKITHEEIEINRFKTIGEFSLSLLHGNEINFVYNQKLYGIFSPEKDIYIISDLHSDSTELRCYKIDDILNYPICEHKLREIITQVDVVYRTI